MSLSISPIRAATPAAAASAAASSAAAKLAASPAANVTLSAAAQLRLKSGPNDVNHDGDSK